MKFVITIGTFATAAYATNTEIQLSDTDNYTHMLTHWVSDGRLYLQSDLTKKNGSYNDMSNSEIG